MCCRWIIYLIPLLMPLISLCVLDKQVITISHLQVKYFYALLRPVSSVFRFPVDCVWHDFGEGSRTTASHRCVVNEEREREREREREGGEGQRAK